MHVLLGQVSDEWLKIITDKGITVAIGTVIIWMLVKYGPRLIEGHLGYLSSTAESIGTTARAATAIQDGQTLQNATLAKVTNLVESKLDPHGHPQFADHIFSTVQTNKALAEHASAIQAFAEAHGPAAAAAVKPHVEEIRRILKV